MSGSITDVPGVRVGHWTNREALTGCTVVLLPEGAIAAGEVRGGAPSTRGFSSLQPGRGAGTLDAVVLAGGSAFGLAACDGVMTWLEEQGRGYQTRGGKVPIVTGMILYDLAQGDGSVRPGPAAGQAACEAATIGPVEVGRVGAATGATVDKWRGLDHVAPGGVGSASAVDGHVVTGALVACNAWGSLRIGATPAAGQPLPGDPFEHTTLGVVITTARLDKTGCLLLAQAAHDGYARALDPVHTVADGDAVVAISLGLHEAELATVCRTGAHVVEAAIRSGLEAVRQ